MSQRTRISIVLLMAYLGGTALLALSLPAWVVMLGEQAKLIEWRLQDIQQPTLIWAIPPVGGLVIPILTIPLAAAMKRREAREWAGALAAGTVAAILTLPAIIGASILAGQEATGPAPTLVRLGLIATRLPGRHRRLPGRGRHLTPRPPVTPRPPEDEPATGKRQPERYGLILSPRTTGLAAANPRGDAASPDRRPGRRKA